MKPKTCFLNFISAHLPLEIAHSLPAGEIADRLAVPTNTMSAHLGVLSRAGLIASQRRSRSIIYRADLDRLGEVVLFLLKDCCQGRAELCQPLLAELAPCCD